MAANKTSTSLVVIGFSLVAYYFIVRLAFIQDINAALAQANVTALGSAINAKAPAFYAYILFVYSFKLGWVFIVLSIHKDKSSVKV